jgi:hypothetical protein
MAAPNRRPGSAEVHLFPPERRVGSIRKWSRAIRLMAPDAAERALAPILRRQAATLVKIGVEPGEAEEYAARLRDAVQARLGNQQVRR